MGKNVLITGGTGFIGQTLCQRLLSQGHDIYCLSRQTSSTLENHPRFTLIQSVTQLQGHTKPDWLINLAGAPILDRPWSKKRKNILRESRVDLTHSLITDLVRLDLVPEVMISGSAIGYYGDTGEQLVTERGAAGTDFAAQLCTEWEQAAKSIEQYGTRLCILRTGVVLGNTGGMLARMKLPFLLGLGGKIGSGQQWISWISLNDICRLIIFLAETPTCNGPFNACTPKACRNSEFTKSLGQQFKRPTQLTLPASILQLGLGEAAILLLGSQYIVPEQAVVQGFCFKDTVLKQTLSRCFAK